MRKKIDLKTTLSKDSKPDQGKTKNPESQTPHVPGELKPTSIRLSRVVLDTLDHMVDDVNKSTTARVSRASMISSLILNASKFKKERLVKVFKDSL